MKVLSRGSTWALLLGAIVVGCTPAGDQPRQQLAGTRATQAQVEDFAVSDIAAFLRPDETLYELITVRSNALETPFPIVVATTPRSARSFAILDGREVAAEVGWRRVTDARRAAFGRMTEAL